MKVHCGNSYKYVSNNERYVNKWESLFQIIIDYLLIHYSSQTQHSVLCLVCAVALFIVVDQRKFRHVLQPIICVTNAHVFSTLNQIPAPLGVGHKLRLQDEVGRWSKNVHFLSTFIPQKEQKVVKISQNLVNVVCERPLTMRPPSTSVSS